MAEYDVNFGKDFNLTVIMDDASFDAYWEEIVEWDYDGKPPHNLSFEKKIAKVMEKWATEDLESNDFDADSATFRPFPGSVTSASLINP